MKSINEVVNSNNTVVNSIDMVTISQESVSYRNRKEEQKETKKKTS